MEGPVDKTYYASRKPELLARFDADALDWRPVIAGRYGDGFADAVLGEARGRFELLIPKIPYIGGDDNHLTGSLLGSARCLALYQAMEAWGRTAAEAGKVLYDAAEIRKGRPAPPIPPDQWLSPEELMKRRRERAERSQERRYAEDWVYVFVEGDGETFDYGYDFSECSTQKLYHAQGADEFLPFYCFLDFPKCELVGLGLSRTMTLAEGYDRCDHRFRIGGRAEQAWPPPFLGNVEERY
jgi:hypothetical protein